MFAKEAVNKGRQIEIDMAKAALIFIFAFVHVTIECTTDENLAYGLAYAFDSVIGGPLGAPMFMFCTGVGMVYTKNSSAKSLFKRGVLIYGLSYVLNLCRFVIPYLIGYAITGDYDNYIAELPYKFFTLDVMQFAGTAFIFMALFVKLNVNKHVMLAIAFIMSIISNFFIGIDFQNPVLNIIMGHFIGAEDAAEMTHLYFPLFNWFIVIASGYVFASYLTRVTDKKKFYLTLSPACILITIAYFIYGINNRVGMFGEGQNCYYHISTPDVMCSIIAAVGMLGVYYALSHLLPNWIKNICNIISVNINAVYCIHWVFVVVITNVIVYIMYGTQELPMPAILIISCAISIMSICIAHIWRTNQKNKGKKHNYTNF